MIIKIDFFRCGVMASFHGLAEFREKMEAQVEEIHHLERSTLISRYDSLIAENPSEERELMAERFMEEEILKRDYTIVFPRILRYSFVMSLFMLMETNLKAVCGEIKILKKLNLAANEFRGSIFERTKVFLEKVAITPLPSKQNWDAMEDLQKIRDCIVHAGGFVKQSHDQKRIRDLISANLRWAQVTEGPLIDPDEEGLLIIEQNACIDMLERSKAFFAEIFDNAGCFGPDHTVIEQ